MSEESELDEKFRSMGTVDQYEFVVRNPELACRLIWYLQRVSDIKRTEVKSEKKTCEKDENMFVPEKI